MVRRFALAVLFLTLLSFTAAAQDSVAFKRVRHLQHGINTGEWFAQSSDYSPQRLRTFTTLEDIDRIAKMGFDHIRLSIDPAVFCWDFPWDKCERVQVLDEVVKRSLSHDVAIIIDIHPTSEYKRDVANRGDSVERFSQLWIRIARHFAGVDEDRIFFELMNEPELGDPFRWAGIQQRVAADIRRYDPNRTIIVSGPVYSDIDNLITMPEFADKNLIFNFHYYSPHTFTHQGASWGAPFVVGLHDLPFPSTDASRHAPEHASDEQRWQLLQYELAHWDPQRIAAEMAFAADWARRRNVPLTCNEFGVYRAYSNPDDRMRWLTATREALEQNKIGWTMWDYRGGFGVVEVKNGTVTEDPRVLKALGLAK